MLATLKVRNQFGRAFFALAIVLLIAGCNRGPDTVPVAGKITIDGKPLDRGFIIMYQEGFRPATARIESDGSFAFKTLKERDGCLRGEHPLTVMSNEVLGATRTKFFIPERYANASTSDAKIKIEEATDNLAIDLTWKGSGHKEPYITNTGAGAEDL
jgi:hypothetical protein